MVFTLFLHMRPESGCLEGFVRPIQNPDKRLILTET
jgi:hypothetical protein